MPRPNRTMPQQSALSVIAAVACALTFAGCSVPSASDADPVSLAPSSPTTSLAPSPSQQDANLEATASEAMTLFARPYMPERRWFTDLLPHLSAEYAEEASYIDPARIPVSKILSGPDVRRDEHNPQVATADFETNDGTWQVVLHQDVPDGQWLVGSIAPTAA